MNASVLRRDRIASVVGALVIHAGLFAVGGSALSQPSEYGIEPGSGGMELHLVAALPEAAGGMKQERAPLTPAITEPEDGFALREPIPEPLPAISRPSRNSESANPLTAVGDGSSAVPGTDPTTFHSEGGGHRDGKPSHLKNPAPPYPLEARRLGQEGLVVLVVRIDPTGCPTRVELGQSSGFPLLDDSALKTVRRWRFRPRRVAGMAAESVIEVPIRFILEDADGRR